MRDSTSRRTARVGRLPEVTSIGAARQRAKVDVRGVIRSVDTVSLGGTPTFRCALADDTGEIDLLFLGRAAVAGLEPGRRCRAVGTMATRDDRAVLWSPRYWLEPPDRRLPAQAARHRYAAGEDPAVRARG
jgi:hypothetical protein